MPMLSKQKCSAAANVDPLPAKVSNIIPFPNGRDAYTNCRKKICGLILGCGAISRSNLGVFWLKIRSQNGELAFSRLSAPAPHFLKFSATVFSEIGFLYNPQGSHIPFGITEISENSDSYPLGRSPPRSVLTVRIISHGAQNRLHA